MGSLTDLANEYRSDKGTVHFNAHCYTRVYEALFDSVRYMPLSLLEIGLLHPAMQDGRVCKPYKQCPSLAMWRAYFPNATLLGFDVEEFGDTGLEKTAIVRGDQGNRDDLERLCQAARNG